MLIFGQILDLKLSKVPKNLKFRAAKMVKMALFGALKLQKLIYVRFEWQKNPEISAL